jgi:putative transposase
LHVLGALFFMARLARVIALDTPHHVTQRGNARQSIFQSDADRTVYLELLSHYCRLHRLLLAGYCLMSNHVHLVAIPQVPESLALALKNTHGRYAAYFNVRNLSSGHVWQGRYYSCPLDTPHCWAALRYVEMNPVRAGLAARAADYAWSSAAVHCGEVPDDGLLDLSFWRQAWTQSEWRTHLTATVAGETVEIRRLTHTGRPAGTPGFVRSLEKALKRRLAPAPGGRPWKEAPDERQGVLTFGQH